VLAWQCLGARLATPATLTRKVTAWFATRTARRGPVRWRFTTTDARIKPARLYPAVHE
jgi:hypothetical protein